MYKSTIQAVTMLFPTYLVNNVPLKELCAVQIVYLLNAVVDPMYRRPRIATTKQLMQWA